MFVIRDSAMLISSSDVSLLPSSFVWYLALSCSSAFNDRSATVVAAAWIAPNTDDVPDTIELIACCLLLNVFMI